MIGKRFEVRPYRKVEGTMTEFKKANQLCVRTDLVSINVRSGQWAAYSIIFLNVRWGLFNFI